jgi:hypothetical protein
MKRGFQNLASRGVEAENRFIAYAMVRGRLSRAQAEKALAYFRRHRLIKIDHVTGQFTVKHGAYLDEIPLRRAAGVNE